MEKKISTEAALTEVHSWLDFKKINLKKRSAYEDQIDVIAEAITDGSLVLNEDMSFTHILKFPIGDQEPISELRYKARLKVQNIHVCLQGVNPKDADGRVLAHISALTGIDRNVIRLIDTEDYAISSAIVVFFL